MNEGVSDLQLLENQVVPVKVTLVPKTNFKSIYSVDDYKTWSEGNCKNAPSVDDMCKYLGAGDYWDDGSISGDGYYDGNVQTYTLPDGKTYHTGLWVMKKAYIGSDVTGDNVANTENGLFKKGRPAKSDIGKYFFLPAAGYYNDGGGFSDAGSEIRYWSSSPNFDYEAFYLGFYDHVAYVNRDYRDSSYLPMVAE